MSGSFIIGREEYFRIIQQEPDCYFTINGRLINTPEDVEYDDVSIRVHPRLRGGKGGFGSMLRAIGNQIEKTNNHDMCRDLSGRRMRDVNAEAKLKEWYAKADERERAKIDRYLEKQRRRREALEKGPLHDHKFNDPEFSRRKEHISSELQDAVEAMLTQIIAEAGPSEPAKKKSKWMDLSDEDISLSSDDSSDDSNRSSISESRKDSQEIPGSPKPPVSTCTESRSESGNAEVDAGKEMLVKEVIHTSPNRSRSENGNEVTKANAGDSASVELEEKSPNSVQLADEVLQNASSAEELESLGLEVLKQALTCRGLKCGGTLSERAARLYSIRGLEPSNYPTKLLAKPPKK